MPLKGSWAPSHSQAPNQPPHHPARLLRGGHDVLAQAGHVHAGFFALVHVQALVLRCQQVIDVLVVDLHVGDAEEKLAVLSGGDQVEHLLHCQRDDAGVLPAPPHRVRLARAGLAVGKDGAVEALDHLVDDGLGGGQVHLPGGGPAVENGVQGVGRVGDPDVCGGVHLVEGVALHPPCPPASLDLGIAQRAHADVHAARCRRKWLEEVSEGHLRTIEAVQQTRALPHSKLPAPHG